MAGNALIEIVKPRLVLLVLWTVTVGYLLASEERLNFLLLFKTLAGSAFVAAGSMALNQYLEREEDARMKRTKDRPLPSGRMKPAEALGLGIFLSLAGLIELVLFVNLLTAALAALTLATYLFLYTPLKTRTSLCTLAGALPGAIPPVMGWSAAAGKLTWEAGILFLILFVWQQPHFFVIAWIYRQDYAQAGFKVLSVVDPSGMRAGKETMIYALILLLTSLLPAVTGMNGLLYYGGAFLLGIWLLASSFRTAFQLESRSQAFFRNSVLYLSLLFLLMLVDRRFI